MTENERKARIQEIIKRIGRKVIAERLQKSDASVSQCVYNRQFPASWLTAIRELAVEAGIEWDEAQEQFIFATIRLAPSEDAVSCDHINAANGARI